MLNANRWVGLAVMIPALLLPWHPAEAMDPKVTEIVIHPAAMPRLAMEHRLLPRYSEQLPGVAAPFYTQAFLALQERDVDDETWRKMEDDWQSMPLDELSKDEVGDALKRVDTALQCVDEAARRSQYGLEFPIADYEKILPTLGNRAQAFRTIARLLVLRGRYRLLEGDHAGAIRSLQSGYAMARHCAEQPAVFNVLVGHAIIQIMNYRLTEVIQSAHVPNLYWTIAALPDPIIDPQATLDFESRAFELLFPRWQSAQTDNATPAQWRAILVKMVFASPWRNPYDERPRDLRPFDAEYKIDEGIEKAQPTARRVLKAAGRSEAELDAMSPEEVAVRAVFAMHRKQCDDLGKWCRIPFWEAEAEVDGTMAETHRLLADAGLPKEFERFAPASSLKYLPRTAANSRRVPAALLCLEAIRLHAAVHGKLPERMEDITEIDIPVNPMTGRSFPYRAEERYVILEVDGGYHGYQWWIRLAD